MDSNMVVARAADGEKLAWAREMAESSLVPAQYRKQPANILYAIELGDALGIPRITAMSQVHVIEGKPSASANLISALVRRAGHRLRVTADDKSATATIWRADDKDFAFIATWTTDRAAKAGLMNKPIWKNYPAAMLKSRAITECARMACEEALSGVCYTPEELGAEENQDSVVINERWNDLNRKIFCMNVTGLGLRYEDVAAWCESLGRPRPSVMSAAQREKCLVSIQPGGKMRAELDAYLTATIPQITPEAPAIEEQK